MSKAEKLIVYIQADESNEVTSSEVMIGDIFQLECVDETVSNRIKSIRILKYHPDGPRRCVISILRIIEVIHNAYPQIEIVNLGPADIIVTLENQKTPSKFLHTAKVGCVLVTSFIGAAYSIMAFSNDVGTATLFQQIYYLFTGTESSGYTILEFTYSVGIVIGILVFFNHFGRKKFTVDPTPMEVEMRLYEKDIQTTLIESYARRQQEINVGDTDIVRNHRAQ